MKRMLCVLAALLLLALPSCGKAEEPELAADAPSAEGVGSASEKAKSGGFDVDLTLMSSTMVYSEVYNMMAMPDDYVGKTVRMKGTFAAYPGEDRNYYVCFIADAAACCQQGMEFVLDGEYVYPDDYPAEGEEITVTGRFEAYAINEYMTYARICGAEIER